MLVSVSLDLSDWGTISDISYGFTQISSALPSSQSQLTPPRPSQWSPAESELFPPLEAIRPHAQICFPSDSYRGQWHSLHAWESQLSRQQIPTSGREKAKADCRYDFSTLLPLMDCSRHNITNQPAWRASLWLSGHQLRNQLWLFMALYEAVANAVTHHSSM